MNYIFKKEMFMCISNINVIAYHFVKMLQVFTPTKQY